MDRFNVLEFYLQRKSSVDALVLVDNKLDTEFELFLFDQGTELTAELVAQTLTNIIGNSYGLRIEQLRPVAEDLVKIRQAFLELA